jgi:hypothetical protein
MQYILPILVAIYPRFHPPVGVKKRHYVGLSRFGIEVADTVVSEG